MTDSITQELTSHGFVWERKRLVPVKVRLVNPFRYDLLPKRKRKRQKRDLAKSRECKRRQREKWLAMGIVQPRTAADFAYMARVAAERDGQTAVERAADRWLLAGRAA